MNGPHAKVAIVGITYRCNQSCSFCLDRERRRSGDMPFDEVRTLFETLKRTGVTRAIFMTGETGLRADFFDVLDLAADLGLDLALTTNGMLFADEDFLARTVAHGLTDFNVSIHGTTPDVVEAICGARGTWERQRQALRNLNARSATGSPLNVYTKTVVCRANLRSLTTIADDLTALLPAARLTLGFKQAVPLDPQAGREVAPYAATREPLAALATHVATLGRPALFDGFPLCCLVGAEQLSRELGDLVAAREYRLAMPAKDDGWIPLGAEYRKTPGCGRCPLASLCLGGLASVLHLTGEDLAPSPTDPEELALRLLAHRADDLAGLSAADLLEHLAEVTRAVEGAPKRRVEPAPEASATPATPPAPLPSRSEPGAPLSPRLAALAERLAADASALQLPAPWRVSTVVTADDVVTLGLRDDTRRVRFLVRDHRADARALARVGAFDLSWTTEPEHRGTLDRAELHALACALAPFLR